MENKVKVFESKFSRCTLVKGASGTRAVAIWANVCYLEHLKENTNPTLYFELYDHYAGSVVAKAFRFDSDGDLIVEMG